MKAKIAAGVLALASLLGAGGYFGKQYFDAHYVLLNEEEVQQVALMFALSQDQAYQMGKLACNKTTSL